MIFSYCKTDFIGNEKRFNQIVFVFLVLPFFTVFRVINIDIIYDELFFKKKGILLNISIDKLFTIGQKFWP